LNETKRKYVKWVLNLEQKNIKLYIVERDENEEIKYAGAQMSNII